MVDALSDPPPAIETTLILASRVEHTSVVNRDGERIGHIAVLSIDRVTSGVVYAIMSFGGFLGIGRRLHPFPWSLLAYDPNQGGYVVALDKEVLADAPHYRQAQVSDATSERVRQLPTSNF